LGRLCAHGINAIAGCRPCLCGLWFRTWQGAGALTSLEGWRWRGT
jgi:hypothetical protein